MRSTSAQRKFSRQVPAGPRRGPSILSKVVPKAPYTPTKNPTTKARLEERYMGNPKVNEVSGSRSNVPTKLRTRLIVVLLIGVLVASGLTILAGVTSTASLTTLGNQERQDISA